MPDYTESDKRIRLGKEIVKLSIELAETEGRIIPYFTLRDDSIFVEKKVKNTSKLK